MIIIGVDPGTRITGYGIVNFEGGVYRVLDYGCIRPPVNMDINDRYLVINQSIEELVEKYSPDCLSVETQYVHKNVKSATMLAMARAAVILAARKKGVEVVEYAPTVAKKAVTGNGRASKHQIQGMTQRLLRLPEPPEPEDAADALCLAICHAQKVRSLELIYH